MRNKKTKFSLFFISISLMFGLFLFKSDSVIGSYGDSIDAEIEELNSDIRVQKAKLESLQNKQEEYAKLIKEKQAEKDTLSNQLDILDNRLKQSELEIEEAILEISKNSLEIKKIEIDIENKNEQIEESKKHIAALIKLLYKEDQTSPLEIILLNDSLADFINQVTYLENTSEKIKESLDSLRQIKLEMEEQQKILTEKQDKLNELKKELDNKQAILEEEITNKEYVLVETANSEKQYQALLKEAKRQNDQASAEIASLEKTVREKLAKKSNGNQLETVTNFTWPVPKNTITTYFRDPEYPFRKSIGEHSAIDIRAAQGTTLRATASGYVARVKFDGSTNYAYIMIIHDNSFSSVYGHVSSVSVSADQYVTQGQVIGTSGGAPRTAGAGPFTTGPHLHFEIRKDGIPVNPLDYLP